MHILATSPPSHNAQGLLYVLALVLFAIGAIIAWATPLLNRAVAFVAVGLAVVAIVALWVQFASS
jgi:hypothetical protein